MSLNYGTLKTKILTDTHRQDLTGVVADFVRAAEGVIYRNLRAAEMIQRATLTDADRVTVDEGFYSLPSDYLEERQLFLNGRVPLESVSLAELRELSGGDPVRYYAVISDREIEFRGVPSTTDEIELMYFARPAALTDDADTNSILTRHESIYVDAAQAELYRFTQDLELAQNRAQSALEAIESLNEQAGRLIGGARTAGYYDLCSFGSR